MKSKFMKTFLILALSVGAFFGMDTHNVNASKRHYVTTPKSIRGTWYHIENGYLDYGVTITKYKFETVQFNMFSGNIRMTLSGKNFSTGLPYPDLAVLKRKSAKGYWTLGGPNFGGVYHFKKGSKDAQGNARLKEYRVRSDVGVVTYWYYSKKSIYPRVKALHEKKVKSLEDYRVN